MHKSMGVWGDVLISLDRDAIFSLKKKKIIIKKFNRGEKTVLFRLLGLRFGTDLGPEG